MNRLVQLRNQIAEAYQLNQTDLAFQLEEMYSDYNNESTETHTIKQHYSYQNRLKILA